MTEFEQAAAGSQISNRPTQEIEEIVQKVVIRLSVASKYQPKGEALRYMADQISRRHRYTLEELYLAVDMYNSKQLGYSLAEFTDFGVSQLNSLMSAYKAEANRQQGIFQQEPQGEDHTERNLVARKALCNQIYTAMKAGKEPEIGVMHCWTIAYNHLRDSGVVNPDRFATFRDAAVKLHKAEQVARNLAIDINPFKSVRCIGADVTDYQSMLAVKEYMSAKIRG